jgi:hypothetical protein
MPENASRALFDQFEDEHRIADWGGDELFTRMPRPRAVDTAPAPRFRPALTLVDPPAEQASAEGGRFEPAEEVARAEAVDDRGRFERAEEREPSHSAQEAALARAERLGLSVVEPPAPSNRFDESGALVEPPAAGRRTKVITGHPGGAPRPLPTVRAERRRPARTPAEWIGPRPERIVAWAFILGLILIVIAITTADAATL